MVRKFPVPSRDVTTKLSLGGNNDVITELFLPRGSLVCDIPAGDGKLVNFFLRCSRVGTSKRSLSINGASSTIEYIYTQKITFFLRHLKLDKF
jgi:hypothetical protein